MEGLAQNMESRKGICEKTMEAHSDKIWCMEPIERIVKSEGKSGNTIEESKMEYVTAGTDGTMIQEKYSDALLLTLDLAQPYQCLTKLRSYSAFNFVGLCLSVEYEYEDGRYKSGCFESRLRNIRPDEFLKLPNSESLVKAFLPYSNRHYERLSNLRTSVSFLDYVFSRMRLDSD
uniref:U3 small nucleolar RNA-associated protein 13 C-terminal domain-containing protein n=1 Tax=Ditylenchus dipsaci TaxID=166011 RepID=A0A915DEC9_9BILA